MYTVQNFQKWLWQTDQTQQTRTGRLLNPSAVLVAVICMHSHSSMSASSVL